MIESLLSKNKLNIKEISKAYVEKKLSPVELVQFLLNRIEEKDNVLNSYITVCAESALKEARVAEREITKGLIKSPLHGIPIAVKDVIYTKDVKTTMGSGVFKDFIPSYDASVIANLKDAGAIIIGKTNTHELAYGPTGDYSYFGPTRNPYDTTKISGGSSSGSAVAVAHHLTVGALGTDTGGSVRIPASFCGIVGMKPTIGSVSKYGCHPLSYTMDHIGPMTNDVFGNAMLLNYLVSHDSKDHHSISRKKEDFTERIGESVKDVVIGIPLHYINEDSDQEVIDHLDEVVITLRELGVVIHFIELPNMDTLLSASRVVAHSEVYAQNKSLALNEDNLLGEQTRNRILQGAAYKAFEYVESKIMKYSFLREFSKIFNEVDFIITPTVPILPPKIGQRKLIKNGLEQLVMPLLTKYTLPYNYLGLPSLAVPFGRSTDGMPLGIQIIGRNFDEANLYRLGYALNGC